MFIGFQTEFIQEYSILRDYYVASGDVNGIIFIICNKESGEIKQFFLEKKYLNDLYEWEKTKKEDADYHSMGIEKGTTSKLIIETGELTGKKKFSKEQTVSYKAKKYRFILQEK